MKTTIDIPEALYKRAKNLAVERGQSLKDIGMSRRFAALPAAAFLRAADALHLACAAEHDFREVHSKDRHFLAAAPCFGLTGVNLTAAEESSPHGPPSSSASVARASSPSGRKSR